MRDDNLSWFFFQRGEIPSISGSYPKRHREYVDLIVIKKQQNFDIGSQRKLI